MLLLDIFHQMESNGIAPDNLSRDIILHALLEAKRDSEAEELKRAWPGRQQMVQPSANIPKEVVDTTPQIAKRPIAVQPTRPVDPNVVLEKLGEKILSLAYSGTSTDIEEAYVQFLSDYPNIKPTCKIFNLCIDGFIYHKDFTKAVRMY